MDYRSWYSASGRGGWHYSAILLTSLPVFVILLLHCQGTVLYFCYIDFWNEQETKTHHARPRHTSCQTWYDQIHSVGLRNAFSYGWRIIIKFIFGQLTRRTVGVGVVKYKRLRIDINRIKSSCFHAHYEGVWIGGGMAPLISTPGTTWRWVINFAPRPLCSCTLHLSGINPRFFGRPKVAWSQYRLRCSVLCDARTCTSIFYPMISMSLSLYTSRYWI
jgi:hypothetical protein